MYSHAWQNSCCSPGRNSSVRAAVDGSFGCDAAGWRWWKSKPGSPDWDRAKPASVTHVSACVSSKHHASWRLFHIPHRGTMLLTEGNVLRAVGQTITKHTTHGNPPFTSNKPTLAVPPVYLCDSPCVSVNSSRCSHWRGIRHEDSDNLKKQTLGGCCERVRSTSDTPTHHKTTKPVIWLH